MTNGVPQGSILGSLYFYFVLFCAAAPPAVHNLFSYETSWSLTQNKVCIVQMRLSVLL